MSSDSYIFPVVSLEPELVAMLQTQNPWWAGQPTRVLPATRRHIVGQIRRRLDKRLAPIVLLRGPRQIGKTTAQLQIISDLLAEGRPPNTILRFQADDLKLIRRLETPLLTIVHWFERAILKQTLNESARQGGAVLFFDEVQNLPQWDLQLKSLVDASTVQVLVTGSSALRLEMGRDSLAGRVSTIEAGVLSLTEIANFHGLTLSEPLLPDNGLEPMIDPDFWRYAARTGHDLSLVRDLAFTLFSQRGGYPLAHERSDVAWPQLADQLNENVVRRVIQHDLRVGERGRKRDAALLEEVFRLACRYVGQSPGDELFAREVKRSLDANVGAQRIRAYLRFLDNALLIRAIKPLEIRLARRKGHAKLCLADHALRASWLQELIPLDRASLDQAPHLSDLAGRLAESVVGTTLASIPGLDLAHLPERAGQPEVDFVMVVGTRRIPVEVKYRRRIDPLRDTEGLRTFLENASNNAPFALLITLDEESAVSDPRIVSLPLSTLMMLR